MVKKQKLTELEEDDELINFVEVLDKTQVIKKNIDELKDETVVFKTKTEKKSIHENSEEKETLRVKERVINPTREEKQSTQAKSSEKQKEFSQKKVLETEPEVIILEPKNKEGFELDFIVGFFQKLFSYSLILLLVDLVAHFSNVVDGVNVLSLSTYESIYLHEKLSYTVVRLFIFILYIFLVTPTDRVVFDKDGVDCIKSSVRSLLFLKTEHFHLPWDQIAYVRHNYRLFESYLHFYNIQNEKIGMINFCLKDSEKKRLKKYLISRCPKNHPVVEFIKSS